MKGFFLIWLAAFAGCIVPNTLWYSYNAFVLENCDPKFGCLGGLQVGLFVHVVAGGVQASIVALVYFFFRLGASIRFSGRAIVGSFSIGLILGQLIFVLFGEGRYLLWIGIAVALSWFILYLIKQGE